MKNRFVSLAALAGAVLMISGCVFAPVMPPRGVIWTDQQAPLFQGREPGSKVGKSSAHNILFLAGWGNAGLDAAMRDGGITELRHADYRVQNYLLLYQKYTTIARGE